MIPFFHDHHFELKSYRLLLVLTEKNNLTKIIHAKLKIDHTSMFLFS
jgi:hypothetical protein